MHVVALLSKAMQANDQAWPPVTRENGCQSLLNNSADASAEGEVAQPYPTRM
jgi:hypothetical protein